VRVRAVVNEVGTLSDDNEGHLRTVENREQRPK
jgi:hypothetical protein